MKQFMIIMVLVVTGAMSAPAQQDQITYDKHGRVTSIKYANGQEIRYEYDGYNNLTSVRNIVSSVDETLAPPTIIVKPNPASEEATIEVPAPEGTAVTFRLITSDGRQVLRKQVLADEDGLARTTLSKNQDGLAAGQYQIAVATTQGRGATSVTFSE